MKKSILKKLVLISCFSAILFTSCEKEPLEAEHANYESNIKKTKVNFDDLKKNEKAFNVFKSLNLTDTKPNIKNSNVQNSNSYNFEIDFNDGTHFSYLNLESYTFPIRRVIDNGLLENIVISEHTDGRYYAKLLKYNLTLQEKIDLANDELKSIQNPIVTEVLGEYSFGNQIQSDCGWVTITTITACANGHTSTSQCNLTGSAAPRIKTITVAIPCNDDSGGGGTGDGSGGYYGDPFNGNGGGGGYITPSFPNDSTPTEYYENGISEPVLSTETNADVRNVNLFYQSLTPQQRQLIAADFNNLMIYNQLIQYQRESIWSFESNMFALQCINQMTQNPTLFTTIKPFLIEKKIDDTNLNPCQKNVLTAVKTTTVADIAQVLAKFDANGSVYNTAMKTEHNYYTDAAGIVHQVTVPANTVKNSPYNYTIYVNPDYAGKTKLFIASIMFHELLHAYFISIIDDYRANPNNNQNLYNLSSLPSLFQAYCDKKYPPVPGTAQNIHHLEMANSYVNALARALQEYQTGTPVPAATNPDQIYTDLAWGGLNDTPIFDETYPVGNPDRQRILNRVACEQNGTPIGQGTPNQQNPIGQPCN